MNIHALFNQISLVIWFHFQKCFVICVCSVIVCFKGEQIDVNHRLLILQSSTQPNVFNTMVHFLLPVGLKKLYSQTCVERPLSWVTTLRHETTFSDPNNVTEPVPNLRDHL